jgi:hypothetical protein
VKQPFNPAGPYRKQIHTWQRLEMNGYAVSVRALRSEGFEVCIVSPDGSAGVRSWKRASPVGVYEAFTLASNARTMDEGGLLDFVTMVDACPACGREYRR